MQLGPCPRAWTTATAASPVHRQHRRVCLIAAASTTPSGALDGSPANLAFLGDALWTLHVRSHYLVPRKHTKLYRSLADKQVTAEMQSHYYKLLVNGTLRSGPQDPVLKGPKPAFQLQPGEREVLKWAVAAMPTALRQRFRNNPTRLQQYQEATALEALVGYLMLNDPPRCTELMACVVHTMDNV